MLCGMSKDKSKPAPIKEPGKKAPVKEPPAPEKPKSAVKLPPPKPAAPGGRGPGQFGVKSWQSGKPHLTAAQLKGKMRKVH